MLDALLTLWLLWFAARVAQKAGFPGWWSLTLLVPVLNVVVIHAFALSSWPRIDSGSGSGASAHVMFG